MKLNKDILISVVIPVNNHRYFVVCLESILKSSYHNLEIIIVLDGVDKSTKDISLRYQEIDKRIKIIDLAKSVGCGEARNIGVRHATGDYVSFIDSDDYFDSVMYEEYIKNTIKYEFPDVLQVGINFVEDNQLFDTSVWGIVSPGRLLLSDGIINEIADFSPSVCNKLFRIDIAKETKFLTNCLWEDIAYTTECLIKAKKMVNITTPMYHYRRIISSSVSSINYQGNSHYLDIFRVCDEVYKYYGENITLDRGIENIILSGILNRVWEMKQWCQDGDVVDNMFYLARDKYGEFSLVDDVYLSSKVRTEVIQEFRNKIKAGISR